MKFSYQLSDNQGKITSAVLEAASEREARNRLALQDGTLVSLRLVGDKTKKNSGEGIIFGKVKLVEKVMLAQHLAVMIKAGMTIDSALETLAENSSSLLSRRLRQILVEVRRGNSFSDALAKFPKDFDRMFINMVAVGEQGGTLAKNLSIVASQQKKSYELRAKLKAAAMYPTIVLLAVVGLTSLISIYVLPKITKFFESLNVELPLTTRIMMATASFMAHYWYVLVSVFFAILLIWNILLRIASTRFYVHGFILKLPVLGGLSRHMNLALFCRTLASLLNSGITIDKALQIVAQTVDNAVYRRETILIYHKVLKGTSLAESLSGRKIFPSLVARMSKVGESSGQLSETLDYMADFYESEVDNTTKNLSTMLEPILLVIIGLVVGFAAMSIINPIYDLTSQFGR